VEWYFPEEGQTFESDEYEDACNYFDAPTFVPSTSNAGHWLSPSLVITPESLGAVKVGTTLEAAEGAAGIIIENTGEDIFSPEPGIGRPGLYLNLNSSNRVNCVGAQLTDRRTVSTMEGFRLGESILQLKRLYGQGLRFVQSATGGFMGNLSGYVLSESSGNLVFLVRKSGQVYDVEGGLGIGPDSCFF
jgi:hypothetical protein